MSLDELALLYNTDKGSHAHNYTMWYDLYLDQHRDSEINFLEIGVYTGASMKMWRDYFTKAKIVGIDINPECKRFETDSIKIHIGSQTDPIFLNSVFSEHKHFEIIIDDGGHSYNQQITSFNTLFPKLSSGGLYIIEDIHTSYVKDSAWADFEITGVEYFKRLIDHVNLHGKSFIGYKEIGNQPLTYFEKSIEYIHFYKSLIVIGKKENEL